MEQNNVKPEATVKNVLAAAKKLDTQHDPVIREEYRKEFLDLYERCKNKNSRMIEFINQKMKSKEATEETITKGNAIIKSCNERLAVLGGLENKYNAYVNSTKNVLPTDRPSEIIGR